jgi:hypothetical protein
VDFYVAAHNQMLGDNSRYKDSSDLTEDDYPEDKIADDDYLYDKDFAEEWRCSRSLDDGSSYHESSDKENSDDGDHDKYIERDVSEDLAAQVPPNTAADGEFTQKLETETDLKVSHMANKACL